MMPDRKDISRRDFLKLGSIVMGALALHSCEKIGFVTPTPEGTQTRSTEVVPPPSSTIEATAPVSIQPMVQETPVAGATSTPEAVSPAVWAPPTLEQMVVEGRGGALDPEIAKYKFEEVIPNGLARIGIGGAVVNFSDNGLSGNDYRWAPLTVNPEGLVIWAYDPAIGQLEWPVKLDPLLDAAGNTYYSLRTEGLSYQPVPDSEGAQIVWGGTKDGISGEYLAVLANDPITLPDGRQVYSIYWNRTSQSWLPTPGLAELLATPTPEATVQQSYAEKLKSESVIESVEINYQGVPIKVNVLSHNSIKGNIYSHTEYVYPDRSINGYDQDIAQACLQGLAQALNKNSDSLVSALKQDPTTGIPAFATDLTKSGYNPEVMTFFPINQITGQANEINIVFMNVPSKDFPGAPVRAITGGASLGRGIDENGNLYIMFNNYPNAAIYTSVGLNGIDLVTTFMVAEGFESLSWKGGQTDTGHIRVMKQRIIYQLLNNSDNPIFKTFHN